MIRAANTSKAKMAAWKIINAYGTEGTLTNIIAALEDNYKRDVTRLGASNTGDAVSILLRDIQTTEDSITYLKATLARIQRAERKYTRKYMSK